MARVAVLIACAVGLVHAASSLYWAFGGRWLLATVGEWAVITMESAPLEAAILLGAVGAFKAAAALIPVGVAWGIIRWERFWRIVCWIGGVFLVAYGGLNAVVSSAVLLGLIRPDGGYDLDAMVGHALLWDPLFLIWGAALILWLTASSPRHAPTSTDAK